MVAFAEDRAKGISEPEQGPQAAGSSDPPSEKTNIDIFSCSGEQAHGDKRVWIDVAPTEETARVVQNIDDLAGCEFNGRAIKLVAEHPGVSSQDAAFFFLLEFYGFHEGGSIAQSAQGMAQSV
jgi:hypothetical protein